MITLHFSSLKGLAALLLGAAAFAVGSPTASAAQILLFNTGVDGSGAVLPDGTVGDPHYTLISAPPTTAGLKILTAASAPSTWLGDNTTSRWIGPNTTQANGPVGIYTYETTFDLTGLDPATATISGIWSTDNPGMDILLNAVPSGFTTSATSFSTGFSPFSFAAGSAFVPGVNTLRFVLENQGGPTGLRVELSGTARNTTATGVPDGGMTLSLLGFVMAGMAWFRRKSA